MTKNAARLFSEQAMASPDRIALTGQGPEMTYAELNLWSDAIAATLVARDDDYNRPVILLIDDRRTAIAAIIASLKANTVFAPLDMRYPPSRLLGAIDVANPAFVLCDAAGAARVRELGLGSEIGILDVPGPHAEAAPFTLPDQDDENAPAYIYFTSGSTGEPKGILGRQKAIAHFARWEAEALELSQTLRCAQLTTPAFDAILRDIFTTLLVGGTICLPPRAEAATIGAELADWLDRNKVSLVHTTPSVLRGLLRAIADGAPRPSALCCICVSGEALLSTDAARFFDLMGDSARLVNFYGPSETTMIKLFHQVVREDTQRHSIPVGKPISGARALVLDSRQRPCGIGMIGEICIRTPFRSLGYYQRPDLTVLSFVRNPMTDDPTDIIYRTGDLGRTLETGAIEFVGRKDRQVKIDGVRVELGEVENALYRHHAVRDTVVVERKRVDGGVELAAFLVLSPEIPEAELRSFLAGLLPMGMIPAHIVSVSVLPRTVTGKIDFAALPDVVPLDPANVKYVAPETPVEVELSKIWCALMQLDAPSATANFFSVGGHSLLALQVLSRVEAVFSVNVSLRDFLNDPTVRGLAAQIEAAVLDVQDDDDLLALLRDS